MIGLDTNALLRLALDDDADQRRRVVALLRGRESRFSINPIVLAEATWTLDRKLKLRRDRVAAFVESVLETAQFAVQFEEAVTRALADYRRGRADFADYLLAEINLDVGCRTTMTFDRDALDAAAFSAVP